MKFVCLVTALAVILISMPANSQEVWENLTSNLKDLDLNTIAVNPQNSDIIYCGSSKAVYKSTDGGKNWRQVLSIKGEAKAVNLISLHPLDSRLIFAATQNGLFKSDDGGMNWRKIFSGIGALERNVFTVALHPKNYDHIYIGTQRGLFWSIDGGNNWRKGEGSLGKNAVAFIAISPADYDLLYVATTGGVFKGGRIGGWKRVFITSSEVELDVDEEEIFSSSELVTGIAFNYANPQNLYLSTHNGLFTSYDAGVSWGKISEAGLTSGDIRFVLASLPDSHFLYAATNRGIFEFSHSLNIWRELYQGITSSDVRSLALISGENSLWAATKGGVFKIALNETSAKALLLSESSDSLVKIRSILNYFSDEPTVGEIHEVAVRYAEVHPDKIESWRRGAKYKALLPDLGLDYDKTITYDTGLDKYQIGPRDWGVSLKWDLSDLIWNSSQTSIDTRSKLMVQLRDDILDEVTSLYFQRRRLQIELLRSPTIGIEERLEKELRLQELTADIDALTGGYLSERLGR